MWRRTTKNAQMDSEGNWSKHMILVNPQRQNKRNIAFIPSLIHLASFKYFVIWIEWTCITHTHITVLQKIFEAFGDNYMRKITWKL